MAEIRPQITYSPEGILTVATGLTEQYETEDVDPVDLDALAKYRRLQFEQMAEADGVSIEEDEGVLVATIDVDARFTGSFNTDGDPDISQFLGLLNRALPYHPQDNIDRVVGLEFLDEHGANGIVYEQFQRWLDAGELTENVARQLVTALALPFGQDEVTAASRNFSFHEADSNTVAKSKSFKLVLRKARFGLYDSGGTDDFYTERSGSIEWSEIDLKTMGDCACWGVASTDRGMINIYDDSKRLYDMQPHNVDFARQALSQILAISTLAYHAARYEGEENVFSNADWGEIKTFPKD